MRRAFPALAAVLLTAACASTSTTAHPAASQSADTPSPTQSVAPTATPSPTPTATPSPTEASTGQLEVAIPAARLPYKPAQGAPELDDVKVMRTAGDPCAIPADDSGNEAQLLDAHLNRKIVTLTFEFTNPCTAQVSYAFHVTQAVGNASGQPGGPGVDVTTTPIQPGKSISFDVNVIPKSTLTAAQVSQLWMGVTRITKA